MSEPRRQLSIGMNILGLGGHSAAWRVKEVPPSSHVDVDYFINIARICERGAIDAIFLADGPALAGDPSKGPVGRLEPTVLLAAIATATTHIGVIATASTSYNEPFNIARRIASLDHISHGRAAWNVVTTYNDAAAHNFGLDGSALHAERYARADEFVEAVVKLWDSWEADAVVGDPVAGVFAHAEKIHEVNHVGKHFRVKGPLNVPRTPQGRPVIFQAGGSEQGKAIGSRYADGIFATQTTLSSGIAFAEDMRSRARAWGRDPNSIKIMPGLSTVIGSTEAEARERSNRLDLFEGDDALISQVAQRVGLAVKDLDPDAPLPWHLLGDLTPPERGSHGFFEAQIKLAKEENLTVGQLSRRIRSGHRLIVGTPEQVTDTIEEWFRAGAADGFNLMPDVFPSGAEVFVDHVVPILRRRGIFRSEYEGSTLRDHLGLKPPANQFQLAKEAAEFGGQRAAAGNR